MVVNYTHGCAHTHTHVRACTHTHTHTFTHAHTCTHTHIHTRTRTHTHTHAHTHTHTHIHTNAHTDALGVHILLEVSSCHPDSPASWVAGRPAYAGTPAWGGRPARSACAGWTCPQSPAAAGGWSPRQRSWLGWLPCIPLNCHHVFILYYPVVQKTEELSHTQSISGSCGYKRQWSSHIPRVSPAAVGTKDSSALTYPEHLWQLWVQKPVELSHIQSISSSCGYKREQSSHIPRVSLAVVPVGCTVPVWHKVCV